MYAAVFLDLLQYLVLPNAQHFAKNFVKSGGNLVNRGQNIKEVFGNI